ncbi:MAG: SAP domain-containing protein [Cyanobacteria bacterium J06627_8]
MNEANACQLAESIYYLKLDELRLICQSLSLPERGAKGMLVKRVLNAVGVVSEDVRAISAGREIKFPGYRGPLKPEQYILPGHYTNGSRMRTKLKTLIGEHFHFTNYGMEWIRERWRTKQYPTFEEFATFWQQEYERRQSGGEFESLATNARVRFFRALEGKGLTRNQLEAAWQAERLRHVKLVSSILKISIS